MQDRAKLLYAHGRAGLAMTAASSLFVVFMVENRHNRVGLLLWLGGMTLALVPRCLDLLVWHKRRLRPGWRGRTEVLRYAAGVYGVGFLWMLLPLLFFASFSFDARVVAAVVFSAMAGGSAAVLGAAPTVAIGYCVMLLVPFSLMFLLEEGRESHLLGVLGLISFMVMTRVCLVNYRAVMKAIRLARHNEVLVERARSAKASLSEANQSLEIKIRERTQALENEIIERRSVAGALAHMASHDPLTGLLNRATLSDRLAALLAAAPQTKAAVLFLDLDDFKKVNDLHGHAAGDQVLRVTADRVRRICLEDADVARWGGDEFVVLLAGSLADSNVAHRAQAILDTLSEPIDIAGVALRVCGTIGIACFPSHGRSKDELIHAADLAMYAAKKEGDPIKLFDHALAARVAEHHFLEQGLREAVTAGTLSVHYQPIFDASSGRCEIMEALLRWTHPQRGPIGPDVFIPVAEQSGQISAVGRFVLREACLAARDWPAPRAGARPPAVSVNVSVAQILSGELLDDVAAALSWSGLPTARLHLEITESIFAADHLRILPVLHELRARGVHLALDDFGTGFSSLALLKTLPIDTIKIDKVFVQEPGEAAATIIQAVLLIARAVRLQVTAEGVETEQQYAMLKTFGANRLQGYLLSRPMPSEDVAGWLLSRP